MYLVYLQEHLSDEQLVSKQVQPALLAKFQLNLFFSLSPKKCYQNCANFCEHWDLLCVKESFLSAFQLQP